jgi:3-dehydroquinate synthase
MEASLVSKDELQINSYKGGYSVTFFSDGIEALKKNLPKRNFHIIIDKRVASLYSSKINFLLDWSSVLKIEAKEENKSLECMPDYVEHLVNNKIRRGDILIAIGGGIIQDITCFLAATILRGVEWQFYPTTLLSQADSCIGSKSSINSGKVKNILGTFTPPKKVFIGSSFLDTLIRSDVQSGIGEMLKVHAISSPEDFNLIAKDYKNLFDDKRIMLHYIRRSLEIKKEFIEVDEFDLGIRNIFNYGHSFGHAIESATQFAIPHGIAVSIGIDMANWISPQISDGDINNYFRMHSVIAKNFQEFNNIDIPIDAFINALSKDKKNIAKDEVALILPDKDAKIMKGFYKNDNSFYFACEEYLNEIRLS